LQEIWKWRGNLLHDFAICEENPFRFANFFGEEFEETTLCSTGLPHLKNRTKNEQKNTPDFTKNEKKDGGK
jgi:hypothetical protein